MKDIVLKEIKKDLNWKKRVITNKKTLIKVYHKTRIEKDKNRK